MFWEIFLSICKNKNMSPNFVCNAIGLSTATATHWKNGTIPKGDVLVKVADYLDCSVDYLLGRSNTTGKKKSTPQNEVLSEDKIRLLDMYDLLTDMEKGEILGELKTLTASRNDKKRNDEIA